MQDKASKCRQHPGTPAIAECDECGAPLCLGCSVPVRGKVLGPECLPDDLKIDLPPPSPTRRDRMRFAWTGVGAVIGVAASALPWNRSGLGSGVFGAWDSTLRWAKLSGIAAMACLLVWALVSVAGMKPGRTWQGALRVTAVLVGAGAALHVLRGCYGCFGPISIGPWVAFGGAVAALAGTFFGRGIRRAP